MGNHGKFRAAQIQSPHGDNQTLDVSGGVESQLEHCDLSVCLQFETHITWEGSRNVLGDIQ
jgi:hypothetical protein